MQIIIIILLIIIIIILFPPILGVSLVAIAALIDLLIKLAIPLLIFLILIAMLSFFHKKAKTKSLILQRLIIFLSVFFILVIAILANISEVFFLSYVIIFSTIVFYIIKCKDSKDFITLKILLGLICVLWGGAIGFEYSLLFGDYILIINREIPSPITITLLSAPLCAPFGLIPYAFPKSWNGPRIPKDKMLFFKEHIKIGLLYLILLLIGILSGVMFVIFFLI